MIVKPFTAGTSRDPRQIAGDRAEKQMDFYLGRAFAADPVVQVYHSLRFPMPPSHTAADADAIQVDHLVIHRYGMVLIESKSVSEEMHVNDEGEFVRRHAGRNVGIPSPLQQVKRQRDALRKLLQEHRKALLNRLFLGMLQCTFRNCPMDVYVAISDGAIIKRSRYAPIEIMKADSIAEDIQALIETHRRGASLIGGRREDSSDAGMYSFADDELQRLKMFLLSRHQQLAAPESTSSEAPRQDRTMSPPLPATPSRASTQASGPPSALSCRHCSGNNIDVVYANNYCIKCRDCGKYTPLDVTCTGCRKPARIKKDAARFTRVCEACGTSSLVWVNEARG